MLYATDGVNSDEDFNKAMVGVGSVWCVSIRRVLPILHLTILQVRGQPVCIISCLRNALSESAFEIDVTNTFSVWATR